MKHVALALAAVAWLAACTDEAQRVPNPAPPSPTRPQAAPLQAWMRANAQLPLVNGDHAAVALAFDRIEGFAPPGYDGWAADAKRGAAAARAGDVDGLRATCKHCHEQFRQRYRTEHRARSLGPK